MGTRRNPPPAPMSVPKAPIASPSPTRIAPSASATYRTLDQYAARSAICSSGIVRISAFTDLSCSSPGLRRSALKRSIWLRRYPGGWPVRSGTPLEASPLPDTVTERALDGRGPSALDGRGIELDRRRGPRLCREVRGDVVEPRLQDHL